MGAILLGGLEAAIADSCDGDARGTATVAAERESGGGPAKAPFTHTVHVCHCTHSHGSTPLASHASLDDARPARDGFPGADRMPADPSTEPRLRPPLARVA